MVRRATVPLLIMLVPLAIAVMPWRSAVSVAQGDATPPAAAEASPVAANEIVLLTEAQVPNGMVMIEDRDRPLDEVVANLSDPVAAREQFVAWNWQRNHIRAFHVPEGTAPDPAAIDGIYISVHEFGSPDAAADALTYSLGVQTGGTDLEEVAVENMGDTSRALYGKVPYGNETTIYVQKGNALIRLSASSPQGDPRAEALELMRTMLESSPSGQVRGGIQRHPYQLR